MKPLRSARPSRPEEAASLTLKTSGSAWRNGSLGKAFYPTLDVLVSYMDLSCLRFDTDLPVAEDVLHMQRWVLLSERGEGGKP